MSDPNATLIECRAEYAVGSAIIAARFFTRWKTLGWRGFYWDGKLWLYEVHMRHILTSYPYLFRLFCLHLVGLFHIDLCHGGVSQ